MTYIFDSTTRDIGSASKVSNLLDVHHIARRGILEKVGEAVQLSRKLGD
ncbi:MAG: hypothetical protein QXE79_00735 [Candidatus Bathyarchaeia archaeon]